MGRGESEAALDGGSGLHPGRFGGGRRGGHRDLSHTGRLLENVLLRIPMPARVRGIALRLAEQVFSGMRAFHDWRRFAGFGGLTVLIWLSDAVGVMVLGRVLMNLAIPFATAFLLLVLAASDCFRVIA